jgi:putative hemolysin
MTALDLWPLLVIAVLLLISALFSAAEISFLALGRRRVQHFAGRRLALLLERLLEHPARTLGAILVTITAVNYTAEAIAANWVITVLHLPVWVAILGMAALVLIFAEVVPITYAAANHERVARVALGPVWGASALLSLPARAVGFAADGISRLLGGRPRPEPPVTEGDIRAIVDLQAETGGLEEEEKAMIHQIFEFGDKVAREVMVPRTDMVAIPETTTVGEAGKVAGQHHISRMPVYRDSLDTIIGTVHIKDVLPLLAGGRHDAPVTAAVRQPLRVPETKKLSDLLTDFRRSRRTLAIVVDEYGGTAGLVTMEDLLEEVVGDIYDEYDVVRPPVEHLGDEGVVLDARMSIAEASQAVGVALPEGEYDSLAGLLYSHLGMVPKPGDRVELDDLTVVVEELDGHRITRARALRKPEPKSKR